MPKDFEVFCFIFFMVWLCALFGPGLGVALPLALYMMLAGWAEHKNLSAQPQ